MVLILITIFVFGLLAVYIKKSIDRYGLPASLSATHYSWKGDGLKYMFGLFMVVFAMGLMPVLMEISGDKYRFLAFLSCGGLMFVGEMPNFKEEDKKGHYIATAICFITSILWAWKANLFIVPAIVFPLVLIAWGWKYGKGLCEVKLNGLNNYFSERSFLFWIEMAAFASLFIEVIIKIIIMKLC